MFHRTVWLFCLAILFFPALGLTKSKEGAGNQQVNNQVEKKISNQTDIRQPSLKQLVFDTQLNYLEHISSNKIKIQTANHVFLINQQQPNYALRYSREELVDKNTGNPVWLTIYNKQGLPVTDLTGKFKEENFLEITAFGGEIFDINAPELQRKIDTYQNFSYLQLTKSEKKQRVEQWLSEEYTGQIQLPEEVSHSHSYPEFDFTVYFSDQAITMPNWISVFTRMDVYTPTINQLPVKIIWTKKQNTGEVITHELILQSMKSVHKTIYYDVDEPGRTH